MREKVQQREYVMTIHAEEEMAEDGFTIFDVERVILAGKIIERQKDRVSEGGRSQLINFLDLKQT